jgi:hypothetical protein
LIQKYSITDKMRESANHAGSRIALFIKLWYTMDNNEMTEERKLYAREISTEVHILSADYT